MLRHLCEIGAVERGQKHTARLLAESGLPDGKTLSPLDEALLPLKVRRQLPALIKGSFVERSVNLLAFGLPGRGKTHFLAALSRELILRHPKRVLFRPAFKLVGQLLAAKRDLRLEQELKKLGRFGVLILDDAQRLSAYIHRTPHPLPSVTINNKKMATLSGWPPLNQDRYGGLEALEAAHQPEASQDAAKHDEGGATIRHPMSTPHPVE